MLTIEPFQRRWLLTFGATLALLLSGAVALSLRLPSFREPAFNFYAMQPGQIFNVYGLTRRQEGSVKLGFAEAYPAPEIGAYELQEQTGIAPAQNLRVVGLFLCGAGSGPDSGSADGRHGQPGFVGHHLARSECFARGISRERAGAIDREEAQETL